MSFEMSYTFFNTMPWMIESLHADILYHGLCLQTRYCLLFMAVCLCHLTMDGHLYHLHIHMHRGHYSSLFTFPHWTFYVGVWKTAPRKCAGNVHYHFNGQMYSLKLFIAPSRANWEDKRDCKTRKLWSFYWPIEENVLDVCEFTLQLG